MDALTLRTGHKNFSYQAPFTFSISQQPEALVTRWALLLKKNGFVLFVITEISQPYIHFHTTV